MTCLQNFQVHLQNSHQILCNLSQYKKGEGINITVDMQLHCESVNSNPRKAEIEGCFSLKKTKTLGNLININNINIHSIVKLKRLLLRFY